MLKPSDRKDYFKEEHMKTELSKSSQNETTLVVFAETVKEGKSQTTKITHPDVSKKLSESVKDGLIGATIGEVTTYRDSEISAQGHKFRHLVIVGLGDAEKIDHETLRHASASIMSACKGLKAKNALVHFDGVSTKKNDPETLVKGLVEGLILSDYDFNELKSNSKKKEDTLVVRILSKHSNETKFKQACNEASIVAETVNFSRRLGDMPGNLMNPTILAESAVKAAKGTGVKVTVWDKARIKKERMGGLLGVSAGSSQDPRFIIMEYKGASSSKKPVVFVGKGLTFDCGGISIKPSANMEEMKYDMCGGANVIGTILAIAKLKLKVNVIALVPSTENLAGPSATKPGDIHTARNGKTFEVNNTDAEGRLILADALSYATELKPEVIFDAATLTGAMVMALGNIHTGFFTRHDDLADQVRTASKESGELLWQMPLTDYHVKDMKGTFADLSNISSGKGAGSATAAAFLEQFVGEGIPWAHFDIAGTAWAVGNRLPYCPKKGASGAVLRTFVELAKQYV